MGGVGGEAALLLKRGLQAFERLVRGLGQPSDLVGPVGHGQAQRPVAAGDLRQPLGAWTGASVPATTRETPNQVSATSTTVNRVRNVIAAGLTYQGGSGPKA
ncbi:hypothetical protein GCM10020001_017380 [Nonomuraea salmonea]